MGQYIFGLSIVNPPKFVPATSFSIIHPTLSKVKAHKDVVPASRKTRVDLSKSKTKNTNLTGFATFMVELGILDQIALNCKL